MNSNEKNSILNLLSVAERNNKDARNELNNVAWPAGTGALASSMNLTTLALQQTITSLKKVVEDL